MRACHCGCYRQIDGAIQNAAAAPVSRVSRSFRMARLSSGFHRAGAGAYRHRNRRGRAPAGSASCAARAGGAARSIAWNCSSVASTPVLAASGPRQLRSSASRPCAKAVAERVADEIAAVLAQDLGHVPIRIPAQRAPYEFVHVVVGAFRIADEADGVGLRRARKMRASSSGRGLMLSRPSVSA